MTRSDGKGIATATLRAGNTLLSLADAIADISPVDPLVHFSALLECWSNTDRDAYLRCIAKAMDDELFVAKDAECHKGWVFLWPEVNIDLIQAFQWAEKHGYTHIDPELAKKELAIPGEREYHSFAPPLTGYFGWGGSKTYEVYGNSQPRIQHTGIIPNERLRTGQCLVVQKPSAE